MKINETPLRTSRNFNINNVNIENVEIPNNIGEFKNISILNKENVIEIFQETNCKLTYGLGKRLENQVQTSANKKLKIKIDTKTEQENEVCFKFDEQNKNLVSNIQLFVEENCKATIIFKYETQEDICAFNNSVLKVFGKENSKINIIIVNLLNEKSNNFMSIENCLEKNAKIKYTIIDFGGKNSITNYYSNLLGDNSENIINTIYLGKENQFFDLNYIAELRGKKTNIDIEVQGALKDNSKKHFKGTIDFKKGCKKATGNENEACMLLSDKAKSIALPMLLCSEEEVEGNHSSSAGKVGEKELFYIMSRGFELKEAMKLMVRAKFNKILNGIKNESIKNLILEKIEEKLD